MKNLIKRFVFIVVTSSVLFSSFALCTSVKPTTVSGTDTKKVVVRRIIQLPGLTQLDDHVLYENCNLCGFYTAFFITNMLNAASSSDYSLLQSRENFDGFFAEQKFQQNIDDQMILAIVRNDTIIKDKRASVASIAHTDLTKDGKIHPEVAESFLKQLDCTRPIGLVINPDGHHWIAGMITIDDAGVVLRLVDSLGHDCTKLPIVTATYDYFVQQAQYVKRSAVDAKCVTAALQRFEAEAQKAAEQLEQQRILAQKREAELAELAQAIVSGADAEVRKKQVLADEELAKVLQQSLRYNSSSSSSSHVSSSTLYPTVLVNSATSTSSSSSTSASVTSQKTGKVAVTVDAKLVKKLADDEATVKLLKQLQAEADAEVARQLLKQEQEERDWRLAQQLRSGSLNSGSISSSMVRATTSSSSLSSSSRSTTTGMHMPITTGTQQQQLLERVQRLKKKS